MAINAESDIAKSLLRLSDIQLESFVTKLASLNSASFINQLKGSEQLITILVNAEQKGHNLFPAISKFVDAPDFYKNLVSDLKKVPYFD